VTESGFDGTALRTVIIPDSAIVYTSGGKRQQKQVPLDNGQWRFYGWNSSIGSWGDVMYEGKYTDPATYVYSPVKYELNSYEDCKYSYELICPIGARGRNWFLVLVEQGNEEKVISSGKANEAGDLAYFEIANKKAIIQYNDSNLPTVITVSVDGVPETEVRYTYDEDMNLTVTEHFVWDKTANTWGIGLFGKVVNTYDEKGNLLSEEDYFGDRYPAKGGIQKSTKVVYTLDNEGNRAVSCDYIWDNDKWLLGHYTLYYPSKGNPDINIDAVYSIGSDNKGSIDIYINLLMKLGIEEGAMAIDFGKTGGIIDIGASKLSGELTSKNGHVIVYTQGPGPEGNAVKSDSNESELRYVMTLAYMIDKALDEGTYTILLNDVNFRLSDGTHIIGSNIPVTIEVERTASGNDLIMGDESVQLYIINKSFIIQSPKKEIVSIYNLAGQLLHSSEKQSGGYVCNLSSLQQGVIIVKGGSGWEKKVLLK